MKKFFMLTAIFVSIMSTISAAAVSSFDTRVYQSRLDKFNTMRVYNVEGEDSVPYVSVQEYLQYLYGDSVTFNLNENIFTATRNNAIVDFNLSKSTLYSENWDEFFGSYGEKALPNGILQPEEFNAIAVSKKHQSTETPQEGFTIDLQNYGLHIVKHEGEILIPFAALQNIFAVQQCDNVLSFNGDAFYDIQNPIWQIYGHNRNPNITLNPYSTAYYSGRFSQEKEIPAAYAQYAYGTTCLLLDLYYGHKAEKGIKDFDSYLAANGLKEALLSTDAERNSEAFLDLFYKLFDSGHDEVILSYSVFNTDTYTKIAEVITEYGGMKNVVDSLQKLSYKLQDKGVKFAAGETGTYEQYQSACRELKLNPILLNYIFRDDSGKPYNKWLDEAKFFVSNKDIKLEPVVGRDRSEDNKKLFANLDRMRKLKPKDFGTSRVDIIGDTAFIYFESFAQTFQESNFYFKLPDEEVYDASTFGLFYDAFAKIQQNSNVKKVVIDLSCNGGGDVAALTAILGFLSPDGEVNLTYYHTLNKNYCSEWYHVDTNLDGEFDARDGFGGQYDFYILTSGFSYSCANALPFFAQADGLAKIIGEQPGGGDCAVANFLDAYGHVANMSGWFKLGRMSDGNFVSDEHAVKVDIPFGKQADKLYFNYEGIAKLLQNQEVQ